VARKTSGRGAETYDGRTLVVGERREFSPCSLGRKCNAFEDVLFDYYDSTFIWRVADDEDSADDEQWFPWDDSMDGRSE